MEYIFPAPMEIPSVATANNGALFPVHRIYCVGRNYAAHAREMGADEREPPFFHEEGILLRAMRLQAEGPPDAKPADAIVPDGATIPYPPATKNFHHEIELVVAIGKAGVDGRNYTCRERLGPRVRLCRRRRPHPTSPAATYSSPPAIRGAPGTWAKDSTTRPHARRSTPPAKSVTSTAARFG